MPKVKPGDSCYRQYNKKKSVNSCKDDNPSSCTGSLNSDCDNNTNCVYNDNGKNIHMREYFKKK